MIADRLMGLGSWSVKLSPETPKTILDRLGYFGHVAFSPGLLDPEVFQDELLALARFVGVVRKTSLDDDSHTSLGGSGMAFWLGDEDGKGEVYETAKEYEAESFANVIRDLLPASVSEGTLHSVSGVYTGRHLYESPREAIAYVAATMGAEWRVNGDGSLDAGEPSDLFVSEPRALIIRADSGKEYDLAALEGKLSTEQDVEDYTTRVVLLAEGEGESIATGSADASVVPYLDLFGNPVVRTRLVSESETSTGNATARAQLQLNRFTNPRNALTLSTETYDVEGEFAPGDTVWVYDPEAGLFDTTNEVSWKGRPIYPVAIRVTGVESPVQPGMGVAYRTPDGEWLDLTEFVVYETGGAKVTVGSFPRTLSSGSEPIGDRPLRPPPGDSDDGTVPAAPTLITPFPTYTFQDTEGRTRAAAVVGWSQPLNSDGSTIVDGLYYEVQHRVNGEAEWTSSAVSFDTTEFVLQPLSPGLLYDARVRAVDLWGNLGAWSAVETFTAQEDDVPPSTPAAPSAVAGNPLRIQVVHELGVSTGGTYNLEPDLSHLEVHVGTSSGFTPTTATKVGDLEATNALISQSIPAVGTFDAPGDVERFVKVVAVDYAGNRSPASGAASVTAELIQTVNIADAAITDAKIGSLSATKITAGTIGAHLIELAGASSILQSSTYVAGASGWRITGDGAAELNDATLRGVLDITGTLAGDPVRVQVANGRQRFFHGGSGGVVGGTLVATDFLGDKVLTLAAGDYTSGVIPTFGGWVQLGELFASFGFRGSRQLVMEPLATTFQGGSVTFADGLSLPAAGTSTWIELGTGARVSVQASYLTLYSYSALGSNGAKVRDPAVGDLFTVENISGAGAFFVNGNRRPDVGATSSDVGMAFGTVGAPVLVVSRSSGPALVVNRNNSNGDLVEFRRAQSAVGSISATSTATSYNTSSDERLKDRIQPIQRPLQRLRALADGIVTHGWRKEPDYPLVDGFLAQKVEEVAPYAVSRDDEGYYQLDASKLVAILAGAILELDDERARGKK